MLKWQNLTVNLMLSGDIKLFNALWFYHTCLNAVVLHEYWFACIFNDLSIGRSKIVRISAYVGQDVFILTFLKSSL
jgi:hypothetical protein